VVEELRSIQTFSSLRPSDRIIIFMGAKLTENCVRGEEILAHKMLLTALAASAIQQRHLIAAAEWLCGTRLPSLLKFFPVILKQLYDEEMIDEAVLLEWADDSVRNDYSAEASMMTDDTLEALRKAAQPFVVWLQEAEEDDEEDDEDETEEED
jgi:translation initiation factor 5